MKKGLMHDITNQQQDLVIQKQKIKSEIAQLQTLPLTAETRQTITGLQERIEEIEDAILALDAQLEDAKYHRS